MSSVLRFDDWQDPLGNLSPHAVYQFAGTAARGSAIPTPTEGMVTYLNDANGVSIYDGSAWKRVLNTTGSILQVVSTTKADAFTTTSTSFVDITGFSVSITPSSTSNKILVVALVSYSNSLAAGGTFLQLVRDSTNIGVSTAGTSRNYTVGAPSLAAASDIRHATISFLDSPATTSALTYKVQMRVASNTGTFNRRGDNTDDGNISSITVMEVAA